MANPKTKSSLEIDWNKCSLCKLVTKEAPVTPTTVGYKSLASNRKQFHDLDFLPMEIDMSSLDGEGGTEETFLKYKAKWHKSCYQKFNTTKLYLKKY